MPNLNTAILANVPLNVPSQGTQKKIAAVLSTLDAKIDYNNRVNVELETMAKTIYDYWFVQFDFPDANGKPYKSSGGRLVYNSKLKRGIPDGWTDSSILAVSELLGGGTPTKKKPEYWGGIFPFSLQPMPADPFSSFRRQITSLKKA